MKRELGPWSWRALPLSGLVTGGLMVPLTYSVSRFRTGPDAELNVLWARFGFLDVAVGVLVIGVVAMLLITFGYWFARRVRLDRLGFLLAASVPVALVLLLSDLGFGGAAASLSYPPTWLMPLAVAVGLAAGAHSYLDAVRLFKARP
jgi:hypothetical protein